MKFASEKELLSYLNNRIVPGNMLETLHIRFTAAGDDYLEAEMPVNARVHQPLGLLHGGASAALAESVGSTASYLHIDPQKQEAVGIDLQINHLRAMREGILRARARAIHLGRSLHVWEIRLSDREGRLIAHAKLTNMILNKSL
jgi:uncharacterized protein (TIGR00369 family)